MRQLIVRGPITEGSGYAQALAAHVRHLGPLFDRVCAVDLTPPGRRIHGRLPFEAREIRDSEVDRAASEGSTLLLTYSTPNDFVRSPHAYNVGLFYWETDRFLAPLNWDSRLQLMDALWLPSPHMEELVRRSGFRGRIFNYPWPLATDEIAARSPGRDLPEVRLSRVRPMRYRSRVFGRACQVGLRVGEKLRAAPASTRFFEARVLRARRLAHALPGDDRGYYLAVFQAVARKGTALLLSEWVDFKLRTGSRAALILKVARLDPRETRIQLYQRIRELLAPMCRSAGLREPDVFVCVDYLPDETLGALYANARAVVSASLGEGFGGPIAEAALRSVPVVLPRHTSLAHLVPAGYRFAMDCEWLNVGMADQGPVYPISARWGLLRPGALASSLEELDRMGADERSALGETLRRHVVEKFGAASLAPTLKEELDAVLRA